MKKIIKNVLLVLIYIFLLFELISIGMVVTYILLLVTENTLVSYAIPCITTGAISAIPVIVRVVKSKRMKAGVKGIIIGLTILLLSAGVFCCYLRPNPYYGN